MQCIQYVYKIASAPAGWPAAGPEAWPAGGGWLVSYGFLIGFLMFSYGFLTCSIQPAGERDHHRKSMRKQ